MPTPSSLTDRELLEAVQQGDTAALDGLFTRYHQRLFSFLARWTGDDHAAEDLVQETFLRLLGHRAGYRHEGEVLAWLYRVARNLAVDRFRRERDEPLSGNELDPADDQPLALDRLTAEERHHHLEEALAQLPVAHREALLLRGVEGLDHRSIAIVLNCSEGAARVRVHRATAALRQLWRDRHGDER